MRRPPSLNLRLVVVAVHTDDPTGTRLGDDKWLVRVRLRHLHAERNVSFFLDFSYVGPEPVLA